MRWCLDWCRNCVSTGGEIVSQLSQLVARLCLSCLNWWQNYVSTGTGNEMMPTDSADCLKSTEFLCLDELVGVDAFVRACRCRRFRESLSVHTLL